MRASKLLHTSRIRSENSGKSLCNLTYYRYGVEDPSEGLNKPHEGNKASGSAKMAYMEKAK